MYSNYEEMVMHTQANIINLLTDLANKKGLLLDPYSWIWNDGETRELPKPGEDWKLDFSSHGNPCRVIFTKEDLVAFNNSQTTSVREKLEAGIDNLLY
jgi:hypothetical protein